MTVTEITAICTALAAVLGAGGMLIRDRRSGRLGMGDHQLRYIEDQQEDIKALRQDLSALWEWAVEAVRTAADAGVRLSPLPRSTPASNTSTAETRDRENER
jgi:hypothetical protein